MKPPKGVKFVSAEYIEEYKFQFTFSDDNKSIVDFKSIILHGTLLHKYLDISEFKKINIDKKIGHIDWGEGEMVFRIEAFYKETEIAPLNQRGSSMTFQERAIIGQDLLSKQPPITVAQARAQVRRIKAWSKTKNKKTR